MHYPADFTADDIMEFEYEYNRYLDLQDPDSEVSVNARIDEIVEEERELTMRDLIISLQEELSLGVLSFSEIARKYEVPTSWVQEAWDLLCEQEEDIESPAYHDELERDWDEPYECEINDNWYDEQYEVDADYV